MFEQIKKLMVEMNIDESLITRDASISSVGVDSLDLLELLMAIEEEYGISIPDEELGNFTTIGDIVDYMESQQ